METHKIFGFHSKCCEDLTVEVYTKFYVLGYVFENISLAVRRGMASKGYVVFLYLTCVSSAHLAWPSSSFAEAVLAPASFMSFPPQLLQLGMEFVSFCL